LNRLAGLTTLLFAIVLSLTACGGQPAVKPTATPTPTALPTLTPTPPPPPLALNALRNTEYSSEFADGNKIKLTDGKYQNDAAHLLITFAPLNASGDLNGDGVDDAAVILASNTGGSGVFYHLAAVINRNGTPQHVASVLLGDRVKIEAMSIRSGTITLDMVVQGPQDPMCCPTQKTRQSYRLEGDKLTPVK
jgi:hypothetical protein